MTDCSLIKSRWNRVSTNRDVEKDGRRTSGSSHTRKTPMKQINPLPGPKMLPDGHWHCGHSQPCCELLLFHCSVVKPRFSPSLFINFMSILAPLLLIRHSLISHTHGHNVSVRHLCFLSWDCLNLPPHPDHPLGQRRLGHQPLTALQCHQLWLPEPSNNLECFPALPRNLRDSQCPPPSLPAVGLQYTTLLVTIWIYDFADLS